MGRYIKGLDNIIDPTPDVDKTSKENLHVLPEKFSEEAVISLSGGLAVKIGLSPTEKKINEIIDYLETIRQADLEAISHHFAIPVKDLEKVLK